MDIQSIRKQIDEIDNSVLKLLNVRASLAIEIGKIKKELNEQVYDPTREKEILNRLISENNGPLDSKIIKTLFERIIDESRGIERKVIEENNENEKDSGV
ncbi:chorismate mutase [candidate division KSB1 bacterium]